VTHRDERGRTLLWAAAAGGQGNLLRQLAREQRLDADLASEDGWTPLHVAAFFGRRSALLALIDLGADVNAKYANLSLAQTPLFFSLRRTDDGQTALYVARRRKLNAAVEVLLAGGADETAADEVDSRPLVAASQAANDALDAVLRSPSQ